MNIDEVRDLLNKALAALGVDPDSPTPLDPEAPFGRNLAGEPNEAPGWRACTSMREAAEREGVANFIALIGGGIKPGAAQMYQDFRPDWLLIEHTIVGLGLSPWGQNWMSKLENRAVTGAAYVRRFGFKPVERRPDGVLVEIEA